MSQIPFYKCHGAGNDFIVIDNRKNIFPKKKYSLVEKLCNRRFGIGADGLLLLNKSSKYDFDMGYYNADGKPGSMCGNGARCIVYFAANAGIKKNKVLFSASDGLHEAEIISKRKNIAIVKVKMNDVNEINTSGKDFVLDTGSPHYIRFVSDASKVDVYTEGKKIRYSAKYKAKGINVNFVSHKSRQLFIRTYERGVENETLACGTGITAAAIAAVYDKKIGQQGNITVNALGGVLRVFFKYNKNSFYDIFLQGEAQMVYKGLLDI